MTHIVYAASDYIPPPGVTVLPLDSHPAIVEDRRLHGTPGRPGATLEQIVSLLQQEPLTAIEIASKLGYTRSGIDRMIQAQRDLFEVVGKRKMGRGPASLVWGVRE